MATKETRVRDDRTCTCDSCFYCFTRPENFVQNKARVRLTPLEIHVSEYVGPETTTPKTINYKNRLGTIPIKVCVTSYKS